MEVNTLLKFMLGVIVVFCTENRHAAQSSECLPRYYDYDSFVCVCNSEHCDEVAPESSDAGSANLDSYFVYTTSRDKHRLSRAKKAIDRTSRTMSNNPNSCSGFLETGVSLCIDPDDGKQTIVGFGGSFTDATAINLNNLSPKTRKFLLKSYFSKTGLKYTLGRVPIGGCDFSTRPYTYDDSSSEDFNLTHFSLQPEDLQLKIPLIHEAQTLASTQLKLVASPWSAPAWMKTSNSIDGFGFLKGVPGEVYYQTWANYLVRFFQEYDKSGINFWAMTAQNEATDGFYPAFPFNNMGFLPSMQRTFVNKNLGPAMESAGFGNVSIYVLDDNRPFLLPWMLIVMNDPLSEKYVAGAALHWYFDNLVSPKVLDLVNSYYPNKPLLMTEVSFLHYLFAEGEPVHLGSWQRAEDYAYYMIQNLDHWVTGWIDWNLALDLTGGPNWADFNLEGTIIVNKTSDEFYKQPIYYVIGHFSKFVPPNSVRLNVEYSWFATLQGSSSVAFRTPDGEIVFVILNKSDEEESTQLNIKNYGSFKISIPPKSIQTYVFPKMNRDAKEQLDKS